MEAVPPSQGKTSIDGRATAYACLGTACSAPVTEAAELRRVLIENRWRLGLLKHYRACG